MLQKAKTAGLNVDTAKEAEVLGTGGKPNYIPADPAAPAHNSLTGLWIIAEFIFKRHYDCKDRKWAYCMNLFRRRTIPPGSLVHESAYQRGDEYQQRLPADAVRVPTRRDNSKGTNV